jgi:tetratricopeptide (TPR) repeat protein
VCARKKYAFRPTAKPVAVDAATGRFGDARKAFETLTQQTPDDPAAWFNLGVVLAWVGEQPKAVEALAKSVDLETDDRRAEEAAALIEVLRCGAGMENDADYLEHGYFLPMRDPSPVMALLREWDQRRRLMGVRANQETGEISGMVVEELPSLLAVGTTTLARVAAKLMIAQGVIRLWHPSKESVAKVADEVRTAVNLAVEQPVETSTPVNFGDVTLEALAYPTQTADLSQAEEKLRDHARHFFEDVWAKRPLRSLAGNTPLDAVGSKTLRKRVFGAVKFVEDCFTGIVPHKRVGNEVTPIEIYEFDDLRHKLGLEYVIAPPPDVKVPAEAPASRERERPEGTAKAPVAHAPGSPKRDISAMSAADLAGLDVAALSAEELEQAMRAAVKLDARDLAVAFAQAGVLKPFDAAKPDRYPLYATAITGAVAEGDLPKAAKLADEGAAFDAEHNAGKRANEFGLRQAQIYSKMKDVDRATAAFEGLISRNPDEGRYYTTAAEEMLRMKNGAKAAYFAEKGLEKARETGNRDLEGHCLELQAAAQKVK